LAEIEIVVSRKSGKTLLKLPDNVPIRNLIPIIVREMNLSTEENGKSIVYTLADSFGTLLSSDYTLVQAGVKQKDTLKLMQKLVARESSTPSEQGKMYCTNCGAQLSDEASFCWQCGKSQKSGKKGDEIRWETAEIKLRTHSKKGCWNSLSFKTMGQFFVEAIGPDGIYQADLSREFEFTFDSGGSALGLNEYQKDAKAALEDLISELTQLGWESVSTHGKEWFSHKFRRRIV
jgi:uncharacterized ubiquitin-like protein YukD